MEEKKPEKFHKEVKFSLRHNRVLFACRKVQNVVSLWLYYHFIKLCIFQMCELILLQGYLVPQYTDAQMQ